MFGEGDDRVVIGDVVAVVRHKLERAHDDIDDLADEAMVAARRVAVAERLACEAVRAAEERGATIAALRLQLDEERAERVAERADWDRLVRGLALANAALRTRLRAVSWAEAGRGRFLAFVAAAWLLWLRVRAARAVPVGRARERADQRAAGAVVLGYALVVVIAARVFGL